jgi:hypothetical protein
MQTPRGRIDSAVSLRFIADATAESAASGSRKFSKNGFFVSLEEFWL